MDYTVSFERFLSTRTLRKTLRLNVPYIQEIGNNVFVVPVQHDYVIGIPEIIPRITGDEHPTGRYRMAMSDELAEGLYETHTAWIEHGCRMYIDGK